MDRIWVVGGDGTGARELLPDGLEPQQLLGWSPDGTHLLFKEQGFLYLTDLEGGEPQVLHTGCIEPCWGDESPSISNDGMALVFVRGTAGTDEPFSSITTMDLSSGQVVELMSTAPKGGSLPNWSPDRKQIVFTRLGRGAEGPFAEIKSAVFIVDSDGHNLRQISPATLAAEYARWSPDGMRLLFTSPNGTGADVYTMSPDGSDVIALTTDGTAIGASWTPDGRILIARLNGGDNAIAFWTMDGDGANAAELIAAGVTGAVAPSEPWFGQIAFFWQPSGGPAIVPPPWQPLTATLVGPPPPTPAPTPAPELAAGFTWTGSIQQLERYDGAETATKLNDGRVLVIKGCDPVAEIYDPLTGAFSTTGSMVVPSRFATATLLQDGRVLIAGGQDCSQASPMLSSAEIYDPATGLFSETGDMTTTRQMHAAALLPDGRVLVAGGLTDGVNEGDVGMALAATGANTLKSAEVYDPVTGTFSSTGSMINGRHKFTATTLADGRVLVLGGGGEGYSARTSAELYDPATGTFDRTGSMDRARWLHTATLLADGRVLIAGGRTPNDTTLASVEVYNPGPGTFTTVGSLAESRQQHTATLLPDGRVLIAGGFTQGPDSWNVLASTEIYDPGSDAFSSSGSMGHARESAVAALLDDGRVLIAGGVGIGPEELIQLDTAVLYQP